MCMRSYEQTTAFRERWALRWAHTGRQTNSHPAMRFIPSELIIVIISFMSTINTLRCTGRCMAHRRVRARARQRAFRVHHSCARRSARSLGHSCCPVAAAAVAAHGTIPKEVKCELVQTLSATRSGRHGSGVRAFTLTLMRARARNQSESRTSARVWVCVFVCVRARWSTENGSECVEGKLHKGAARASARMLACTRTQAPGVQTEGSKCLHVLTHSVVRTHCNH